MGRSAAIIVAGLVVAAVAAGSGTAGHKGPGASATGSGHITYFDTTEQQEGRRTFSFSAHRTSDGGATGTAHVNNRPQELKQDIDVDCLDVEGTTAWLGGVITRSTVSQFVGRRVVFAVQDNGEGKSAPDRMSFVFRQGSDPMPSTDCNVFHPAPAREVQNGNIQVRS